MAIDSFAAQAASNSETSLSASAAQTPRSAQTSARRPGDNATTRSEAAAEIAPALPRVPRVPSPPLCANNALPQASQVPGAFHPGTSEPSSQVDPSAPLDMRALIKRLSDELGEETFERYFLGQAKLAMRGSNLCVTVTSTYLSQLIDRRFGEKLRRATGATVVKFEVDRSVFTAQAVASTQQASRDKTTHDGAQPQSRPRPLGRATPQPLYRYSLDNYLVGHANRLAHTAVKRLIEAPHVGAPVFIHGACGLGKTHLLQGACSLFLKLHPGANVRYVTGENFTNDFIQAVRNNRVDGFRKMYRGRGQIAGHSTGECVELLCIDDVHFLSSKDATQQELLHTFDALGLAGTRILIASDEHPREIRKLSEKLVSRFLACCVAKLETPDTALRRDLVRQLALQRGLMLDPDAIEVLVQRSAKAIGSLGGFGGSVRELEGLLNQVEAMSRLMPPDSSSNLLRAGFVLRALGIEERVVELRPLQTGPGTPRRPIAIQTIVEQVCKGVSVDIGEFAGSGRHKRVVFARSVAAHLARQLTTQSFPEIARAMGRTNHSTIITAQRRLQRQLETGASQIVEHDLAPLHPGCTFAELLQHLAAQIRSASR